MPVVANAIDLRDRMNTSSDRSSPAPSLSSRRRDLGGVVVEMYRDLPPGVPDHRLATGGEQLAFCLSHGVRAQVAGDAISLCEAACGDQAISNGEARRAANHLWVLVTPRTRLPSRPVVDPSHPSSSDIGLSDPFLVSLLRTMVSLLISGAQPSDHRIWGALSLAFETRLASRFGYASDRERAASNVDVFQTGARDRGSRLARLLAIDDGPRIGKLAIWQEKLAKDLLSTKASGRHSIDRIAKACRLSRGHFSKAFRHGTGRTPVQWATAWRVEKAKLLLLDLESSLSDIASQCGFSDQSHFTRVFHSATKVTPGVWRRRYRS